MSNYIVQINYSWVGTKRLSGLVVKLEIFDIIGVVFTIDTRTSIDDCGRGVMFKGTQKKKVKRQCLIGSIRITTKFTAYSMIKKKWELHKKGKLLHWTLVLLGFWAKIYFHLWNSFTKNIDHVNLPNHLIVEIARVFQMISWM